MSVVKLASNLYLVPVKDKYQVYLNNELIFNGCLVYYTDGALGMVVYSDKYKILIYNYNDINFGIIRCNKKKNKKGSLLTIDTYIDIYLNQYKKCISKNNVFCGYTDNKATVFYYDNKLIIKEVLFDSKINKIEYYYDWIVVYLSSIEGYSIVYYNYKYDMKSLYCKDTIVLGKYFVKQSENNIIDRYDKICVKYDILLGHRRGHAYYIRNDINYLFYDGIEYIMNKKLLYSISDYLLYNGFLVNIKIFLNLRKKKMLYAITII